MMKLFLVEFINKTDIRDNEVYKVKARSISHARQIASNSYTLANRFTVGEAVPYCGGTKIQRRTASEFKTYCCGELK
jgi:hypothetical protein